MTFTISNSRVCECVRLRACMCACLTSPSTEPLSQVSYLKQFWLVSQKRKYNLGAELQVHSFKALHDSLTFHSCLPVLLLINTNNLIKQSTITIQLQLYCFHSVGPRINPDSDSFFVGSADGCSQGSRITELHFHSPHCSPLYKPDEFLILIALLYGIQMYGIHFWLGKCNSL